MDTIYIAHSSLDSIMYSIYKIYIYIYTTAMIHWQRKYKSIYKILIITFCSTIFASWYQPLTTCRNLLQEPLSTCRNLCRPAGISVHLQEPAETRRDPKMVHRGSPLSPASLLLLPPACAAGSCCCSLTHFTSLHHLVIVYKSLTISHYHYQCHYHDSSSGLVDANIPHSNNTKLLSTL
jgi:hypothetical protein